MINRTYFVTCRDDFGLVDSFTFTVQSWFAQPAKFVMQQAQKLANNRKNLGDNIFVAYLSRIS